MKEIKGVYCQSCYEYIPLPVPKYCPACESSMGLLWGLVGGLISNEGIPDLEFDRALPSNEIRDIYNKHYTLFEKAEVRHAVFTTEE